MPPTVTDPAKSLERATALHQDLVAKIQTAEAEGYTELASQYRRSLRSTRAMISQLTVRLGGERPTFSVLAKTPRTTPPGGRFNADPDPHAVLPTIGARFVFDEGEWCVVVDGVELFRSSLGHKAAAYAKEHGIVFPAYDPRDHEIDVTGATQRRNT